MVPKLEAAPEQVTIEATVPAVAMFAAVTGAVKLEEVAAHEVHVLIADK